MMPTMAVAALPSLPAGAVIAGRYTVTARLGGGGMGDVYEVEHQLLGRRFALKRLAPDLEGDRDMIERFLREARAAAQTGHPGVVEVFDLGFSDDGWPYLVMERLRGDTLRERLRRGAMDARLITHVATSVLDALAAVHDRGIIHRDIKPENLFLCAGDPLLPRVKVLDFGIAHLASELGGDRTDLRLTRTGAVMGTPAYMSPEQARGVDVDVRTDLYSTGVVLYECVAGRPPFAADAYSVLVARILEDEPDLRPLAGAGDALRGAIARALVKRREDRFPSAAAMRVAIAAAPPAQTPRGAKLGSADTAPPTTPDGHDIIGATEPVAVTPPPSRSPSPSPISGSVRLILPLAGFAVAAVIAALWLTAGDRTDEPPAAAKVADVRASWEVDLFRGDLDEAATAIERAARRQPDDVALVSRELLLLLLADRTRAYARLDALDNEKLPALGTSAMVAIRAMRRGVPLEGAAALEAPAKAAAAGSSDELMLRFARAEMLRQGDRFDLARAEYLAVLARWPAFAPAVEGLLQRLLVLDEIDAARSVVDRFVAHAPDGPALHMVEIELAIGERRYRDALDGVERLIAANPGREAETYQYRGDLRLLLGDVDGAIAAYDAIDDQARRDEYVAGALLHAGRAAEARQRLLDAIAAYPAGAKPSRLGKMVVDAALLGLETGDRELAERGAQALAARDALEAQVQSARAFARAVATQLGGGAPLPDEMPLGEASPMWALLASFGKSDDDARRRVLAATAPEAMHFGVVVSHVYPVLWLERARLHAAAGELAEALAWTDRVVRPRHYDASRGIVIARALTLRADVLERLGRGGEAQAVRRELESLRKR
jgi:serine/threonine protein kinase